MCVRMGSEGKIITHAYIVSIGVPQCLEVVKIPDIYWNKSCNHLTLHRQVNLVSRAGKIRPWERGCLAEALRDGEAKLYREL